MSGILRVLMTGVACLAIGVSSSARASSRLIANLEAGESQNVVVYGTSLTACGGWVPAMKTWLDAQYPGKVTLTNSGMPGLASQTGINNLTSKVLNKNPDTVFIEFAVNDAFNAYAPTDVDYNITPAESVANLNAMIDAIMAGHPEREVILQTTNPAWDAPNGNQSATKRPSLAQYFQGYRDVAEARGLLLIDNYLNWSALQSTNPNQFKSYVADGVHPNNAGYAAIVDPVIRSALVPEPTVLAPLAGAALAGRRRRR